MIVSVALVVASLSLPPPEGGVIVDGDASEGACNVDPAFADVIVPPESPDWDDIPPCVLPLPALPVPPPTPDPVPDPDPGVPGDVVPDGSPAAAVDENGG